MAEMNPIEAAPVLAKRLVGEWWVNGDEEGEPRPPTETESRFFDLVIPRACNGPIDPEAEKKLFGYRGWQVDGDEGFLAIQSVEFGARTVRRENHTWDTLSGMDRAIAVAHWADTAQWEEELWAMAEFKNFPGPMGIVFNSGYVSSWTSPLAVSFQRKPGAGIYDEQVQGFVDRFIALEQEGKVSPSPENPNI